MTVKKVDDFIPYKIFKTVELYLNRIKTVDGYNTDPLITISKDDAENSNSKYTVLLEAGTAEPVDQFPGNDSSRKHVTANYVVMCYAKYETEHPRRLAYSLEQDVRNAIDQGVADLRGLVGRGVSFKFGTANHDGGLLAPYKEAGFELSFSFTWSQSNDW